MDPIQRIRFRDPLSAQQLIQMHLSFVIDMDLQSYHDDSMQHERNKNDANFAAKKKENGTVFGAPLTQEGICVIYQLIQFIDKEENIRQEGIFRKSGSSVRQADLKNWLNCGTTIDLATSEYSVHDCTSVLKSFLCELPEPLLTEAHFHFYCQLMKMGSSPVSPHSSDINSKQLKAIQLLLLLLPDANRTLLQDLLSLLNRVALNSMYNKMDSQSLATLFAPHLLCPKNFSALDLQLHLHTIVAALKLMIDHKDIIFRAPNDLLQDVERHLLNIEKTPTRSTASEPEPVNTLVTFCVPNPKEASNEDFTERQVAELYAYIQGMPETPQKKKLIKKLNRENGHGTPLTKLNSGSSKKSKTFSNVLKRGHQLLFGSSSQKHSLEISKKEEALNNNDSNNESKDPQRNACKEKNVYKRLSATNCGNGIHDKNADSKESSPYANKKAKINGDKDDVNN